MNDKHSHIAGFIGLEESDPGDRLKPSSQCNNENKSSNCNEIPASDSNSNRHGATDLPQNFADNSSHLEIESATKIKTQSRRTPFASARVSPQEQTQAAPQSSRNMEPYQTENCKSGWHNITMLQSTVGAGTITLPYAIYANGLILGPLLMVGAALLSYYTGYLLAKVGAIQNKFTFKELAITTYGKKAANCINLLVGLDMMGVATAYLVLLKNLIPHTIKGMVGDSFQLPEFLVSPFFWLTVVTFLIIFPLLLMRTVHSLQFTSYVGFVSVIYLTLLVIFQFSFNCDKKVQNLRNATLFKFEFKGILTSYPMIFFAYFFQTLVPSVQYQLHNHTLKRMRISFILFLSAGTLIYIALSVFGYLSFVHAPDQLEKRNILQVTDYADRVQCQIAFIFFTFVIVTATAINFKPVKDSFKELLLKDKSLSRRGNFCMTICLITICYVLALVVPIISDAIQVKSCTTSPIIFMIVPILLHFKVDGLSRCSRKRFIPYFVIVLMVVASVLGFIAFLLEKLEIQV